MKTLFLSISLITAASLYAQTEQPTVTSGRITFEEKVKLNIKIDGGAPPVDLPKERKSRKLLTFNADAAIFEDGNNNTEDVMSSAPGDGGVRIRMVYSGDSKIYTDLKNDIVTEQRDFMNRIFLVEKKNPSDAWKVTGQQKDILGYKCFEAVRQDTSGNRTIVWFAPSIPVKAGPAGLGNLPGMVLEADFNSGSRVLTAKSIETAVAEAGKIQKPKEGKKVTEEEYKSIVSEKMKEMGIEHGSEGGNQMQVVIRHQ